MDKENTQKEREPPNSGHNFDRYWELLLSKGERKHRKISNHL